MPLNKLRRIAKAGLAAVFFWAASASAGAGELAGHKFLVTSVRTGDTQIFIVDPETGDAINLSRSPKSEDRYPCWSPE
jgi:TolB protein